MSLPADHFDALYARHDDPWNVQRRWYERRKRDLTLALLPRQRYRSVFEPGCSIGALSAELAPRCERLLCCDSSPRAVALARERLQPFAHASAERRYLPKDFPAGTFDLIVLSEMAYYLDEADLLRLIESCVASLEAGGSLLACHWLHPLDDGPLDGRQVHRLLHEHLPLARTIRHQEADFLLELWCDAPTSVDLDEEAR